MNAPEIDTMSGNAAVPDTMQKVFAHIDGNRAKYIATLGEAVKIKSVSAWPETREVGNHHVHLA